MNKNFSIRLNKLRDIYKSSEDQKLIDEIEQKIRNNITKSKVIDRPEIQAVVEDAKKRVTEINILLAYDEELNAPTEEARVKRWGLFRERSIHQFYLDRFGVKNIEAELESLDKYIDSRIAGGK